MKTNIRGKLRNVREKKRGGRQKAIGLHLSSTLGVSPLEQVESERRSAVAAAAAAAIVVAAAATALSEESEAHLDGEDDDLS